MSTTELAAQSTPSTDQTLANAIDQPLRSSTDRPIDSAYLRTGVAVAPYAGERVRTIRKARRRPVADAAGTMDEVLPATDDPLSALVRSQSHGAQAKRGTRQATAADATAAHPVWQDTRLRRSATTGSKRSSTSSLDVIALKAAVTAAATPSNRRSHVRSRKTAELAPMERPTLFKKVTGVSSASPLAHASSTSFVLADQRATTTDTAMDDSFALSFSIEEAPTSASVPAVLAVTQPVAPTKAKASTPIRQQQQQQQEPSTNRPSAMQHNYAPDELAAFMKRKRKEYRTKLLAEKRQREEFFASAPESTSVMADRPLSSSTANPTTTVKAKPYDAEAAKRYMEQKALERQQSARSLEQLAREQQQSKQARLRALDAYRREQRKAIVAAAKSELSSPANASPHRRPLSERSDNDGEETASVVSAVSHSSEGASPEHKENVDAMRASFAVQHDAPPTRRIQTIAQAAPSHIEQCDAEVRDTITQTSFILDRPPIIDAARTRSSAARLPPPPPVSIAVNAVHDFRIEKLMSVAEALKERIVAMNDVFARAPVAASTAGSAPMSGFKTEKSTSTMSLNATVMPRFDSLGVASGTATGFKTEKATSTQSLDDAVLPRSQSISMSSTGTLPMALSAQELSRPVSETMNTYQPPQRTISAMSDFFDIEARAGLESRGSTPSALSGASPDVNIVPSYVNDGRASTMDAPLPTPIAMVPPIVPLPMPLVEKRKDEHSVINIFARRLSGLQLLEGKPAMASMSATASKLEPLAPARSVESLRNTFKPVQDTSATVSAPAFQPWTPKRTADARVPSPDVDDDTSEALTSTEEWQARLHEGTVNRMVNPLKEDPAEPERLSPQSLAMTFSAHLNMLDTIHDARVQLTELEKNRLMAESQQESVVLAQAVVEKEREIVGVKEAMEAATKAATPVRDANAQVQAPLKPNFTVGKAAISDAAIAATSSADPIPTVAELENAHAFVEKFERERLDESWPDFTTMTSRMIDEYLTKEQDTRHDQEVLLSLREKTVDELARSELEWIRHQRRVQQQSAHGDEQLTRLSHDMEKAIMMRLATEKAEISRLRLKARGLSERKRKAAMTAQIDAVVDVDISEQRRKSERKANTQTDINAYIESIHEMAREVENNSRRPKGTLPPVVVKSTPPAENDVSQDETTIAEDSTQSSLDDGDNLQKLVTALQELKQQARTDKLEEKQRTVELSRHLADELLTQRRMKNEQEARLDRDIKQVTETLKEALELERQSVKVEALSNEVAVVTEAKMTEHASAPDPKVQMAPIANLVTVQSQPSVRRPPASEAPARSQKFAPTPSTLANVPLSADKSTDSEISEEIEAEPSAASSIEEELPEEYTVPTDDAPDVNEVEEQIYDETFDSYAVDEELIRPHVDDEEREESPERSDAPDWIQKIEQLSHNVELAGERQQQAAGGSEEDISVDLVVPVFEEPQAASTSDVAAPTGAAATPENKSNPVEVIAAINAFLKSEWDAVEQGSNHSDTADENHSRMLSDTEDEEDAQTDGKLEDDLVDEEKHNGVQQELRPTMQRIETPPDDEMLEIKVSPPFHKKEEPTEERPLSNTPTTAVTLPTFVFDSVLVDAPEPASVDVEDSPASRRRQLVDRLKTDPPSNATIDEITASFMEDIMHEAVELAKLSFIDHAHLVDVVKPNFEASACVQGAEELITRIEPRMYRSIPTFPRDALDDAFGALTVDVLNEAMSAVFTDATDKKHSLVAKLFGAPTISGKELSAKALAAVKKWTDHKPTDGDNLDRMLTEEVKREERKWMDLEPEEDAVCEAVFDGLWDDLLEDVVHGLDAFERCRSERQRIATVVQ